MPIYQYTAMDAKGKEQKGKLEAENEEAVAKSLQDQGLFVTSIKVSATRTAKKKDEKKDEKKNENAGGFSFNFVGKIKT